MDSWQALATTSPADEVSHAAGYEGRPHNARALELTLPGAEPEVNPPATETAAEIALKNGVYHEIRRKLQTRFGIPPAEIAFIHEADTPAKKAALFEAVNAGRVRVLLGSTAKLGTGVNVQERLVALHHLDQPWKPAEWEQREGRILRQGNIYPEVLVFHYVTERSFDGYMLQTLEAKARFISQIMAGEVTARTAEDVGEMVLTVAQVKAIASGHPLVQRRIELEVQLVRLDRLRAAYYRNRAALLAELESLPARLSAQAAEIAGHEAALRSRQPLAGDAFRCTLRRDWQSAETLVFDQRERAGAHLRQLADGLIEQLRGSPGRQSLTLRVGAYRGFTVLVSASGNSRWARASSLFNYNAEVCLQATVAGPGYVAQIGESNVGITQAMDYRLRRLEERLAQAQAVLAQLQARQTGVQAELAKPWGPAAAYCRLRREYQTAGASLAAAGVDICDSFELAAPEEDPSPEPAERPDASPAATAAESVGPSRNPLTGLESYPLTVTENEAEAAAHEEAHALTGPATVAPLLGFGATPESAEEDDIFAVEPVSEAVLAAPSGLNITPAKAAPTPVAPCSLPRSGPASGSKRARTQPAVAGHQQSSFAW